MRIEPGQFVMVAAAKGGEAAPLPAEVQQIRYVNTKNGESAVAVVIEIGEMPLPRVLELEVIVPSFDPMARLFDCPEVISMADPVLVAEIVKRLADQREHMRLAIQASLQAPREISFGGKGAGSVASKEKQKERAKLQRAEMSNLREMAISNVMAEKSCTREQAIAFFNELAKERGY